VSLAEIGVGKEFERAAVRHVHCRDR
jgi:hypothetical protein